MSDSEPDEDLLELLRKSLGTNDHVPALPSIKVLDDAEYVYNNSTDVALDMRGTKNAASTIYKMMQDKGYGTQDWSLHELHPKAKDSSAVDFIFLMDLLNFSFWSSSLVADEAYAVDIGVWMLRFNGLWMIIYPFPRPRSGLMRSNVAMRF